jgi:hypothetical protein
MHVTQLAGGTVNGADQLLIELRESDDAPPTIGIIWPAKPTISSPERLSATINAAMAILSRAATATRSGRPGGDCRRNEAPESRLRGSAIPCRAGSSSVSELRSITL